MKAKERRRGARTKEFRIVKISYGSQYGIVPSIDWDKYGARIKADLVFPLHAFVIVEIESLCKTLSPTRLLAEVVHFGTNNPYMKAPFESNGVGLRWVRAFCPNGQEALIQFLTEILGYEPETIGKIGESVTGEAVLDFDIPTAKLDQRRTYWFGPEYLMNYYEGLAQIEKLREQKFRVEATSVFSVGDMSFSCTVVALNQRAVEFTTHEVVPVADVPLSILLPITKRGDHHVKLKGVSTHVLAPTADRTGRVRMEITSVDEMGHSGLFSLLLRRLKTDSQYDNG